MGIHRVVLLRSVALLAATHVVIALVNLSPLIDLYTVGQVLDVNLENTAVVWLSSGVLLAIAVAAAVAAAVEPAARRGWALVSAAFVLLSIDETASLHELAGELGSRLIQVSWLPSLYVWVIVVAPFAAAGAVWMMRWFGRTLGWRTGPGRAAVVAIVLWMTVPLFEAIDPSLGDARLLTVVEESVEAAGEVLMLWAVLSQLRLRGVALVRSPAS